MLEYSLNELGTMTSSVWTVPSLPSTCYQGQVKETGRLEEQEGEESRDME